MIRHLPVAIDFHSMGENILEVNGDWQLFGNQHSSKCLRGERNSWNRFETTK